MSDEGGFSLIEALVALAVLAIATVGLVGAVEQHIDSTRAMERRAAALWVAENRLAELSLGAAGPQEVPMLGERWRVAVARQGTDDPEIARVWVTVSARGTDRRTALEDLTQRNARALELARGYGEAVEKLETGTFSVQPELTDKGRRERVHAYHGRVRLTAVVRDFTVLGELALDGSITPVAGVLPAAMAAYERGNGLICPEACGSEAAWASSDIEILARRAR